MLDHECDFSSVSSKLTSKLILEDKSQFCSSRVQKNLMDHVIGTSTVLHRPVKHYSMKVIRKSGFERREIALLIRKVTIMKGKTAGYVV